jgi:hypothetical protein
MQTLKACPKSSATCSSSRTAISILRETAAAAASKTRWITGGYQTHRVPVALVARGDRADKLESFSSLLKKKTKQ